MKLKSIHKELTNLLFLVERWDEQGYCPSIEIDIAKKRLQKLYEILMEEAASTDNDTNTIKNKEVEIVNVPTPEPEPEQEPEQEPEPTPEPSTIAADIKRHHYINILFGGDVAYYESQMAKINEMQTLDEMLIYVTQQFHWQPSNTVAEEFVGELAQKYL